MNITTAECDQAFAQIDFPLLDNMHGRSRRSGSSLPRLTFILLVALISVSSIPPVSQAQMLGDPVDVSQDFQKMENVYFIGSRVVSFDAATGSGHAYNGIDIYRTRRYLSIRLI